MGMQEGDDLVHGGTGREYHSYPGLLKPLNIRFWNDPARDHQHVPGAPGAQLPNDRGEQLVVGAGEDGDADHIYVLVNGSGDDLRGGAVQPRVDHLKTGVPKATGDDLRAAIMAIEAGFGDQDTDAAIHLLTPGSCGR